MRRSILARVKFLSRLFTALNLLPSIATLASVNTPPSVPTGLTATPLLTLDFPRFAPAAAPALSPDAPIPRKDEDAS